MHYALQRALQGMLLILGVTAISFLLMVWFGPDQTYTLIGKNATTEQIAEVRRELGYDRGLVVRYAGYLRELITLDLGYSQSTGESVNGLLARTLPITLLLMLPGFLLGNFLGVALALYATRHQGHWSDRLITGFSVASMSLSFLVIIILLQVLLCTPYGLNWFPVRGWEVHSVNSWLYYSTVPSLALVLVTIGYNTRFYRAVFVEEYARDHIRTGRALGASESRLLWVHVLRNSLLPLSTRILFSIPLVVISGSLLVETYFGIPGIGKASFDAISNGDQPVLKAVVGLSAVAFVVLQTLIDVLYHRLDPRVSAQVETPAETRAGSGAST